MVQWVFFWYGCFSLVQKHAARWTAVSKLPAPCDCMWASALTCHLRMRMFVLMFAWWKGKQREVTCLRFLIGCSALLKEGGQVVEDEIEIYGENNGGYEPKNLWRERPLMVSTAWEEPWNDVRRGKDGQGWGEGHTVVNFICNNTHVTQAHCGSPHASNWHAEIPKVDRSRLTPAALEAPPEYLETEIMEMTK